MLTPIIIASCLALYSSSSNANPTYQECLETHLDAYRKAQIEETAKFQKDLIDLKSYPEVLAIARDNHQQMMILHKQVLDYSLEMSKRYCTG